MGFGQCCTHETFGNINAKFGVKKYKTKCGSVADVIDILNRHPAYEEFRIERTKQAESGNVNYPFSKWFESPEY